MWEYVGYIYLWYDWMLKQTFLIGLCLRWDISIRDILGFLLGVRGVYLGLFFLFQGFYPPVNYTIHPAKWRVGRLVSMK
jgi:hypothetical protein